MNKKQKKCRLQSPKSVAVHGMGEHVPDFPTGFFSGFRVRRSNMALSHLNGADIWYVSVLQHASHSTWSELYH